MHGTFPPERLEQIRHIEQRHFWFACRRALVRNLLKKHVAGTRNTIFDLGCGTGFNLALWEEFGSAVFGLDQLAACETATAVQGSRRSVVCGDVCALPLANESVDVVIALDVLEHVPDDVAVAEIERVLKPQGKLVLTVPAMPWLWSFRDEAAGHLRRYTGRSLHGAVTRGGLRIERTSYYQFLLFPLFAIARLLGRRGGAVRDMEDQPNALLNAVLRAINGLEVALIKSGISFPWGSSLMLVASKP